MKLWCHRSMNLRWNCNLSLVTESDAENSFAVRFAGTEKLAISLLPIAKQIRPFVFLDP